LLKTDEDSYIGIPALAAAIHQNMVVNNKHILGALQCNKKHPQAHNRLVQE